MCPIVTGKIEDGSSFSGEGNIDLDARAAPLPQAWLVIHGELDLECIPTHRVRFWGVCLDR